MEEGVVIRRRKDIIPLLASILVGGEWHKSRELEGAIRRLIPPEIMAQMQRDRGPHLSSEEAALRHAISQLARDMGAERRGGRGEAEYRLHLENRVCEVCNNTFQFAPAARNRAMYSSRSCSQRCKNILRQRVVGQPPKDELAPSTVGAPALVRSRQEVLADAQKRRMIVGVSAVGGWVKVFQTDVNFARLVAAASHDELEEWGVQLLAQGTALRRLGKRLRESRV